MQDDIQQLRKQLNDIKIIITEEKKDTDNKELKEQMQILQQSVNKLMNQSSKSENKPESDVVKWLRNTVKLPQYISLFNDNGFDNLDYLLEVKPNDLEMLGVELMGHRMKIMREIAKLNQQNVNKPPGQYDGSTPYI